MYRGLISCALALAIVVSLGAQDEMRGLTPIDVANLKNVSSAVLSDDGKYVAYTLRVQADPLVENVPARSQLHVYDLEQGTSAAFITRASVRGVAFRPGHSTVTFLGRLDGAKRTAIYEISLAGGEASELVTHGTSISNYEWDPSGERVVFVATEASDKAASDLPYQPEIYEGDLSYRYCWIATPGSTAEKITDYGNIEVATWSPDGNQLLMSISSSPLVDDHYMEQTLHIVNPATGEKTASIDHAGKLGEFTWSPDGSQIAFIAGADINDPIDGRLFVAPATGGAPTAILPEWQGAFEDIEWLSGNMIHYLGSKGAEAVFGTVDVSDQSIKEMVDEGLAATSFDANASGEMCFVASTATYPGELFYSDGSDAERLTVSNPWLDEIAFGKQEVIRYKAADGLEVEGILVYPTDYDASQKYPTLVCVHGGPEAHIDNGWVTAYSRPGQVAAANGYAVFYPNYRGSTGRGLEYTLTSQGDPAGKEFDDIVDGVKHLTSIGLADADKVGVTGGSYGGYATAWLSSRYTEYFAGGVMFVGISDKVSKWGTTDIPNEEYLVHARKWVYDDYDFFLKRSPIYYAGDCETPLLIMHGKEDPRVHPSQSMEMYRHVKSRTDTPVELIFYPGEGHGNARSTARYDYNLRMMSWFDKYVKGEDRS